jgi:hypothetical protein
LFQVNLTQSPSSGVSIKSTQWIEYITCQGYDLAPVTLSGGLQSTQVVSSIPGLYEIIATTTYASTNPSVAPPPPTSVANTIVIPAPDNVVKLSGMEEPTLQGFACPIEDQVSAKDMNRRSYFIGQIQEDIVRFKGVGVSGGSNGWYPPAPAQAFYFNNSIIHDQQFYPSNSTWASIAVGTTLATIQQELRFAFNITTINNNNETLFVDLPSPTWTMVKISATQWEVY